MAQFTCVNSFISSLTRGLFCFVWSHLRSIVWSFSKETSVSTATKHYHSWSFSGKRPVRKNDNPGNTFPGKWPSGNHLFRKRLIRGEKDSPLSGKCLSGKKPSGESNHLANDRIPSCLLLSSHWRQFSILLNTFWRLHCHQLASSSSAMFLCQSRGNSLFGCVFSLFAVDAVWHLAVESTSFCLLSTSGDCGQGRHLKFQLGGKPLPFP